MDLVLLAAVLLVSQIGLLAAVLHLRYLHNRRLFKTDGALKPIRTKNAFFGTFNGLYDLFDRIPFFRRSGTANEFDLLKAILITTVPLFALQLLIHRPSAFVALMSANFLLLLVNGIVLAHPMLKGKRS